MIGRYTITSTEVFSAASAGRLTDVVEDTELSRRVEPAARIIITTIGVLDIHSLRPR